MCFAPQRRALFRHRNFKKWSEHGVFCTFCRGNVLRDTTACTFSTSQLQKVVRDRQFLTLLTWKCASRHNGVHFFDIATSKSGPRLVCFVHFDLEMCFAPQRRALFRHRNFKKWSDIGVFCTFWLGNVLRATTACTFSSLIWPAGSAPAALASLRFDPPEPQIIGKTQWIATFSVSRRSYLFAHLHLLSSDLFSSDSSHLCFSTVHIVGSFTSKLPSTMTDVLDIGPMMKQTKIFRYHPSPDAFTFDLCPKVLAQTVFVPIFVRIRASKASLVWKNKLLNTETPEVPGLVICYIANWKITMLLMGKSTISMAIFNSYVSLPEGIWVLSISQCPKNTFFCHRQLHGCVLGLARSTCLCSAAVRCGLAAAKQGQ